RTRAIWPLPRSHTSMATAGGSSGQSSLSHDAMRVLPSGEISTEVGIDSTGQAGTGAAAGPRAVAGAARTAAAGRGAGSALGATPRGGSGQPMSAAPKAKRAKHVATRRFTSPTYHADRPGRRAPSRALCGLAGPISWAIHGGTNEILAGIPA